MKRLLALTWKEFLQLKRDPITLRLIVFVPVMQTLVFGYAINYDVKHLKMVVHDEAKSVESRDLISKMVATEYFTVVGNAASLGEVRHAIDSAQASVGLVIDRNFGKDFHRGRAGACLPDRRRLRHDDGHAGDVDRRRHRQRPLDPGPRAASAGWKWNELPLDLRVRPWYNPELKTARFVIPGLIAIILTFTLIQFTAERHRAGARARHARAAPGHAGHAHRDHPRKDRALHAHRPRAADDDPASDAVSCSASWCRARWRSSTWSG